VNSDRQFVADVLVEDGLIVRIDQDIEAAVRKCFSAVDIRAFRNGQK